MIPNPNEVVPNDFAEARRVMDAKNVAEVVRELNLGQRIAIGTKVIERPAMRVDVIEVGELNANGLGMVVTSMKVVTEIMLATLGPNRLVSVVTIAAF